MRADRLLQLAEHLETGKLGHEKFDFTCFNRFPLGHDGPENVCGTAGCAIGEMPVIAPERWYFSNSSGQPYLRGRAALDPFDSAAIDFEISDDDSATLFTPCNRTDEEADFAPEWVNVCAAIGIKPLGDNAGRRQVAANIRRYVAFQQAKAVPTA